MDWISCQIFFRLWVWVRWRWRISGRWGAVGSSSIRDLSVVGPEMQISFFRSWALNQPSSPTALLPSISSIQPWVCEGQGLAARKTCFSSPLLPIKLLETTISCLSSVLHWQGKRTFLKIKKKKKKKEKRTSSPILTFRCWNVNSHLT